MTESRTMRRIETHSQMGGILFAQQVLKRVAEPEDRRGIETRRRGKTRRMYKCIICAIYKRVGIQKEESLLHMVRGLRL